MYNTQITLTIPENLREVANQIAQAFDPDVGGNKTFNVESIDGLITVTFPCVTSFAEALPFFKEYPETLYESTKRDFALRWLDDTPPTLEQVTAFCESVQIT